jgi:hypothetical protein
MRVVFWWPLYCAFGCGSALGAGIEAYEQARYPEAAREFAALDGARMSADDRARSNLYTGLNHLALGNLELAARHLTRARDALERDPWLLSAEDEARLFTAWRALGRSPGLPLVDLATQSAPANAATANVIGP